MPLKSKPKLPVTIKLQSRCWFYFGKKKKRERKRKRRRRRSLRRRTEGGEKRGRKFSNIWNQSVCKRGGTGRDGWGGKKEAEEEEKNQMKIRTDTQEKEECG